MLYGISVFSTIVKTCMQLSFFLLQPDNVENCNYISWQQRMLQMGCVLSKFIWLIQAVACFRAEEYAKEGQHYACYSNMKTV